MKSKRIQWLDFAKGFLIFTVLIMHAIVTSRYVITRVPYNTNVLNNNGNLFTSILGLFMMQGFFAISGYLYKPTNTVHKYGLMLYKKLISIMLPGVIFTIIDIAFQNYLKLGDLFHRWYELFICEYGDTWFLTTLFFIFLVAGLMDLLHFPLYLEVFLSLVFLFIGKHLPIPIQEPYIIKDMIGGNPLTNIRIYIIFFYLGYLFKRYNIPEYLHNNIINIIILLIGTLGVIIDLKYIHLRLFITLFSVVIVFMVCVNFPTNNYLFKFFDKYGKYTLIIYLVHWPIVYFIIPKFLLHFNLVNAITNNAWFLIPLKILVTWLVSIIVCYISNRSDFVNFIFYPRKYLNKLLCNANIDKNSFHD